MSFGSAASALLCSVSIVVATALLPGMVAHLCALVR
jgi:hypothetical protein